MALRKGPPAEPPFSPVGEAAPLRKRCNNQQFFSPFTPYVDRDIVGPECIFRQILNSANDLGSFFFNRILCCFLRAIKPIFYISDFLAGILLLFSRFAVSLIGDMDCWINLSIPFRITPVSRGAADRAAD